MLMRAHSRDRSHLPTMPEMSNHHQLGFRQRSKITRQAPGLLPREWSGFLVANFPWERAIRPAGMTWA